MRKSNSLTAVLYWIILLLFLYSYIGFRNPLSLSVVADRVVDALSISLVFLVNRVADRPITEHYSYGFHRAETLLNVSVIILFLILAGFSAIETTVLLMNGIRTSANGTFLASVISIPLLLIASIFIENHESSNFRVMFLHSIQDIAVLIVALAFSIVSIYSPLYFMGYLGSYIVLAIILYGNRKIFARNVTVLMEGTPLDIESVEENIRDEFPNAHHLHVWDICQHERVATLHLKVPSSMPIGELDTTKREMEKKLSRYGVTHVTIQFEPDRSKET